MFDEPFARGASPLHGLDPRFRLALAVLLSVCLAVFTQPAPAALGLVLALLLLAFSRPPLGMLLKRLAVINVFILFLWMTVPWTMPGEPLLRLGPVVFSRPGVALAGLVTLKANAIAAVFLALVATMDSATIGYALDRLGLPSKLVFLFLFTYRYLHVIADEWQRLRTAARLRGFVPRTDMRTYRTTGHLLGMVLVNSYDRSERVYRAMLLRGFAGRFRSVVRFHARRRDFVFALCCVLGMAGLLMLEQFPELLCV